jgi:hypothetical protein
VISDRVTFHGVYVCSSLIGGAVRLFG